MKEIADNIIDFAKGIKTEKCCPVIIAIDGRCGSGKSTVADMISQSIGIPVVHMDHFFLRPEQRSGDRLAEPGGNVDRERIFSDVLLPLRSGADCSYRPYDCSIRDLGDAVYLPASDLYIIEGSYSCHPELWDMYDLRVFLTVDPAEQTERITLREGAAKWGIFREKWIPMEEKYFDAFSICERCDLAFDTTNKTDKTDKTDKIEKIEKIEK